MSHAVLRVVLLVFFGAVIALPAAAGKVGDGIIEAGENATDELARAAQNPLASMISLPFQNNTGFNLVVGQFE